jgi:hypothetical protein
MRNEPYSPAIITIIQMMETLPLNLQNQIVQHLQNYLLDLQDDIRWETSFAKTETNLVAAARKAKQDIAAGQAIPLNYEQL